eukprot:jgi/Psemu1/316142/fgenesh1_kg.2864_\
MASKEAFLPVPTEEDSQVPSYRPDGPGSQSFLSIEDGVSGDVGFNTSNHHLLFCGVCCDHRRAVLVVNAITIGFQILSMIVVAIVATFVTNNLNEIEQDMNDDEMRKDLDGFVKEGGLQVVESIVDAFAVISIGLHSCGIYGALQFKQWGIITAACSYSVSLLLGLFTLDIANLLMSGLFLYPHIFMLKLMKEGVMTDYNYHKIATCCGNRQM